MLITQILNNYLDCGDHFVRLKWNINIIVLQITIIITMFYNSRVARFLQMTSLSIYSFFSVFSNVNERPMLDST